MLAEVPGQALVFAQKELRRERRSGRRGGQVWWAGRPSGPKAVPSTQAGGARFSGESAPAGQTGAQLRAWSVAVVSLGLLRGGVQLFPPHPFPWTVSAGCGMGKIPPTVSVPSAPRAGRTLLGAFLGEAGTSWRLSGWVGPCGGNWAARVVPPPFARYSAPTELVLTSHLPGADGDWRRGCWPCQPSSARELPAVCVPAARVGLPGVAQGTQVTGAEWSWGALWVVCLGFREGLLHPRPHLQELEPSPSGLTHPAQGDV